MRISSLKAFHEHVGEAIMYCQRVEYNLKLIYAALQVESDYVAGNQPSSMLRYDIFHENFKTIQSKSMGDILSKLEERDEKMGGNRYLRAQEYELLKELKDIRNHWAHEGYLQFLYSVGKDYEENFRIQAKKLKADFETVRGLYESVEKVSVETLQNCKII